MSEGSLAWFHAVRLQERGLVKLNKMRLKSVTELGQKVLQYVESELSALGEEQSTAGSAEEA